MWIVLFIDLLLTCYLFTCQYCQGVIDEIKEKRKDRENTEAISYIETFLDEVDQRKSGGKREDKDFNGITKPDTYFQTVFVVDLKWELLQNLWFAPQS